MKRREFLSGLVAGAGTLALPLPKAASATAVAAKAKGIAAFHYGWACVYAQMNDGITPADVSKTFKVSRQEAEMLFQRMRDRGVIHPPGLDGRSRATQPWQPWDKRHPQPTTSEQDTATQEEAPRQTGKRARLKFKRFMMLQRGEADELIAASS